MRKLIGLIIILALVAGGYMLYQYYQTVESKQANPSKNEVVEEVYPSALQGMPYQLEKSLEQAQAGGVKSMRDWLKHYGPTLQDPRKAWIELDFAVMLSKDDPAGARKLFAEVKQRTPPTSPVWPRIQKLSKTYE